MEAQASCPTRLVTILGKKNDSIEARKQVLLMTSRYSCLFYVAKKKERKKQECPCQLLSAADTMATIFKK